MGKVKVWLHIMKLGMPSAGKSLKLYYLLSCCLFSFFFYLHGPSIDLVLLKNMKLLSVQQLLDSFTKRFLLLASADIVIAGCLLCLVVANAAPES